MAYVNIAKFTAVSAGTGSFVVSAAVQGYQTPASAGATTATVYSYRAENASLTEWEIGTGTYTTGTVTLTRTPSASTNGGAAVNFTLPPQVALTALAADLASAASLTAGTLPGARLPNPSYTVLGGVLQSSAITNQFLTRISSLGAPTAAQPAFSNLSSGIAVSQMNSGSGATSATFWRGDGTWNTPAAATGTLVSVVYYSSTQTITVPTGATKAFVELWGGAGGSGGGDAGAGVPGGGGGGFLQKYLTGLVAGGTLALTIGAGGTAGSGIGAGGSGGSSILASGTSNTITTLTASGGSGTSYSAGAGTGGAGGTGTNGDVNITGQVGGSSIYVTGESLSMSGAGGMTGGGRGRGGAGDNTAGGEAGTAGGCTITWFT